MTRPLPARATARRLALSGLSLWALATAAQAEDMRAPDSTDLDQVVITAARTILPASALPLTVDVIDNQSLSQQVSVSGSIIDAISTLSPSFSPTRQKLSGAGESLRGRSPLYAINGIPQSTPIRDGSRDGYTIDPFFIDRVELIYGSNALQGIGATGGVVNQVTVGAPKQDGVTGRTLVQATGGHDLGDALGGKLAGLISCVRARSTPQRAWPMSAAAPSTTPTGDASAWTTPKATSSTPRPCRWSRAWAGG